MGRVSDSFEYILVIFVKERRDCVLCVCAIVEGCVYVLEEEGHGESGVEE
jgi:hypothetical protein